MPSLHPDPLESFRIGWPVARGDGLDDLARFIAEPGFRRDFRLPGGQFALCERDDRTGIVAALRDPTATMPLHAHYDGTRWLVCTSIRRIEAVVGRKFALKLEVLKKLHQTMQMNPDESLYHEVELLAPGVIYLFCRGGQIEKTPVPIEWPDPASIMAMSRKSPESLVEEGLAIVERSVIDAVDSSDAIVQQSGGLDSNLILHTAVRAGLSVAAHGMVFPGLDCDESNAMRKSCEIAGVAYDPVDYGGRGYDEWKDDMFRCAEYVPFTTTFMLLDLGRRARDLGHAVMLNGMGGDEIFDVDRLASAALLSRACGARPPLTINLRIWREIIRGTLDRRRSGRRGALASYLVSSGWHFQMSGVQLLLDAGIELRMPLREWRATTQLLPLVATCQIETGAERRRFQRELLDATGTDLCANVGFTKAIFGAVGYARGPDSAELGKSRYFGFARLVPEYTNSQRRFREVLP